jgi:hypothetical protein
MPESTVYRVRIKVGHEKVFYFVNAMSPIRALTTDAELAQRFSTEQTALHFFQTIIHGGNPYFDRLRAALFELNEGRVTLHVDFARMRLDGMAGVWSEIPKGGIELHQRATA